MSQTLQSLICELIKYDHKTITVSEAIEIFINKSQSTVKATTLGYYRKHLKGIHEFLNSHNVVSVDQITPDILYQFIAQERARKLKNNSINKAIECLMFVLNYCLKQDYINQNPLKNFKKLPADDVETQTINENLLNRIFNYLENQPRNPVNVRDHLMILLLLDTGVRRGELRNIKLENINLNDRSIYLTHTKTNKNRFVYMCDRTIELIKEYLNMVDPYMYLLVNIKDQMKPLSDMIVNRTIEKIKKDLKIPDKVSISPHKWRHTYATMCLNNGADIIHVQKFLGHTSLRMTQRYTHKENDRLKKEHDLYSPVGQFKKNNVQISTH